MFFWMFFLRCFEAVRPAQTMLCLPGEGDRRWPLHPLGTPGCQVRMEGVKSQPVPSPCWPQPCSRTRLNSSNSPPPCPQLQDGGPGLWPPTFEGVWQPQLDFRHL